VADKSSQLVLTALTRAAAEGAAVLLHGNKTTPGLFPTTTLGKQAAQRCWDEGYLCAVEAEPAVLGTTTSARTRTVNFPLCSITDKGLSYLLGQVSPRQVLEDFVRVLESRETAVAQLVALARQMQTSLEALRAGIAPVLDAARLLEVPVKPVVNGDLKGLFHDFCQEKPAVGTSTDPAPALVAALRHWVDCGASEDQPLPELFRQTRTACPTLTIGAFHDALRRLQEHGQVCLHPWTGPLYDIPEPAYALLVGHVVAYYANLRKDEG
jgi:hypothetical protein